MSIFMPKFAGDDYSAIQGPCPDGFHVPLQSEWEVTYEILVTSFGLDDNRNTIQTYLKMPSAGYRFIYGGAAIYQDYYGYYWSCSGASSDAYYLDSSDSHIYPDVQTSRTYGCTLRAFKNTATAPDSSWTTLYQGTGAAGIYHNSSLGLISLSSDGSNWITIADKNVGATQIYNNGDTLSEANCGKYYQRGNNYGFAWTGSVTTSSITVNASTYGPGNYYNSSTFITGSYWDTSGNNNLRGGETGVVQSTGEPKKIYIGDYKVFDDYSAMRGPCPEGFHVPTTAEWNAVFNAGKALGAWSANPGTNLIKRLRTPKAGRIVCNYGTIDYQGSYGTYRCSDAYNNGYGYYFDPAATNPTTYAGAANGFNIRAFKDTPVVPDSTWTVYHQGTGSAGIFRSSALGLISISSDGTTRYTIQDKNLGATQLYNYGDTLSEANCGYYYQRGNNYGFPFTGPATTSSTQIDASSYGPGNYYSSSTFIKSSSGWQASNNLDLWGGTTGVQPGQTGQEVQKVYMYKNGQDIQIRPEIPNYLCFTANTAGSTVQLTKNGSPTSVTLETSTDGETWNTYTFGSTITLSNIGDKIYWRNTSEITTGFSLNYPDYYTFVMTGSIAASGDVTYLLNKNGTDTLVTVGCFYDLFDNCTALTSAPELPATNLTNYCYRQMFANCTSLTTPPDLPATTLAERCYHNMFNNSGIVTAPKILATTTAIYCCHYMFRGCSNLEQMPRLYAKELADYCYRQMFYNCPKIKLSTTQTGEYQTAYKIPYIGSGITGTNSLQYMFTSTGGTFADTPSINTTYYTSNTVV